MTDVQIQIHDEATNSPPLAAPPSIHHLKGAIQRLESKLDYLIGFNYWKRYVAAAFWSNLSTPFNLAITLLTAVMAAHSSDGGFVSAEVNLKISIVTLFVTTLNTFFRPHVHATENVKCMNAWMTFGYQFETVYYRDTFDSEDDLQKKLEEYQQLLQNIYTYKTEETNTSQNFVTDLLHLIVQQCCLYNLLCDGKGENWLSLDTNRPKQRYCCVSTCCLPTQSL